MGAPERAVRSASVSSAAASPSTGAMKAMRVPSGLQIGAPAPSGRVVSCVGSPPERGMVQSWPSRWNASVAPSGENAGLRSVVPCVSAAGVPEASASQRALTPESAAASLPLRT